MHRIALALAFGAVLAAVLPAPAQFVALGLGIGAIGTGRVVYTRRALPGAARLTGAAAITVGIIGLLLGLSRVGMTLAAIGRIEGMLT